MKFVTAVTVPVWLFIMQFMLCIEFNLNRLIPVYLAFLVSYYLGALLGTGARSRPSEECRMTPLFRWASKLFIAIKAGILLYFLMIFLDYVSANGYTSVRGYMTSERISSSAFYSAPLMYLDAYIAVPLNFTFLAVFSFARERKMAIVLAGLLVIQYAVIFAGRMVFYNLIVFGVFYLIYKRVSPPKILARIAPFLVVGVPVSLYLLFARDNTFTFGGVDSISGALMKSAFNYHMVPPLILNSILQSSQYFNSHVGYGLATFGFLTDPFIAIFFSDPKSYMASKLLSAEAQNYIFYVDGQNYNAFTTFLYPALFDFGTIGPVIYGLFFGFLISYSYKRRDWVGGVYYVVISFFVYFNSFTFFITGDWFFALFVAPLAFRKLRKGGHTFSRNDNPRLP